MKHTYRILLSLALAILCLASGFLLIRYSTAAAASDRIASEILRFHVIANSDSAEDQALKLQVKEALIQTLHDAPVNSRTEMVRYVISHQAELIELAEAVIAENGYDYAVRCEFGETYFPTKTYGDLTFPCGEYLAFRIILGDGAGKNWWCVLYPPLCFVDITTGIVPDESKETLEQLLTDEDYDALADQPTVFRFRLWDFLQEMLSTAPILN